MSLGDSQGLLDVLMGRCASPRVGWGQCGASLLATGPRPVRVTWCPQDGRGGSVLIWAPPLVAEAPVSFPVS